LNSDFVHATRLVARCRPGSREHHRRTQLKRSAGQRAAAPFRPLLHLGPRAGHALPATIRHLHPGVGPAFVAVKLWSRRSPRLSRSRRPLRFEARTMAAATSSVFSWAANEDGAATPSSVLIAPRTNSSLTGLPSLSFSTHQTSAGDDAIATLFKLVDSGGVLPGGYRRSPPPQRRHHASCNFRRSLRSHDGPKSSSPSAAHD
jgi:hypothetical protein